jgi:hypothetical protein
MRPSAQFNLNDSVTVHLTEHGVNILRKKHVEFQKRWSRIAGKTYRYVEFVPPKDNMYTTQMWMLMEVFGEHMGIARENPFDLWISLHGADSQSIEQTKRDQG